MCNWFTIMNDTVRSAARVLDMVELLSNAPSAMTLSGIAERMSTPKSSTLMLLRTLVARGYAVRTDNDRYEIAADYRAGAFGWRAGSEANLVTAALPILEQMTAELGESTTLGILAGPGEARLLRKIIADVAIRWDSDTARPIPLYCTAIGRALLSPLPIDEQRRQLEALPRPRVTHGTITKMDDLIGILARVRATGHVIVSEEFALGGTGFAAPILDQDGGVLGAINVACVTSRLADKQDAVIAALMRGKVEIERRLRASPTRSS
jgi:IclR family pca regulon transcriptional regulator